MKEPEPGRSKKAAPDLPRHDRYKYLNFTIMHEEATNVNASSRHSGATTYYKTTWIPVRKAFSWSITRPETGKEPFSTNCMFCQQPLGIKVESLASLARIAERAKKMGVVYKILGPVILLALLASFLIPGQTGFGIIQFICVIGLFVCLIGAVASGATPQPGYAETGVLLLGRSRAKGPFTGHYVEKVESSNEKI